MLPEFEKGEIIGKQENKKQTKNYRRKRDARNF